LNALNDPVVPLLARTSAEGESDEEPDEKPEFEAHHLILPRARAAKSGALS